MAYISDYKYYKNDDQSPEESNFGSYQYISLKEVVNNFMNNYVGNDKYITKASISNVLFHAKQAVKELNYDAFKNTKRLELSIDKFYRFVMPSDYVDWIRVSMYKDGALQTLSENIQTQVSDAYLQDNDGFILFDLDGNILRPENSDIDYDRITNQRPSIYLDDPNSPYYSRSGYKDGGDWFFRDTVTRYGIDPSLANTLPTFTVDRKNGVFAFSSSIGEETVILEYISDGMENGDDSLIVVNKFFERYMYSYIEYVLLSSTSGIQEYVVNRKRKEQMSLLRNARIRMSNINPSRLLMNLRGQNKWLK